MILLRLFYLHNCLIILYFKIKFLIFYNNYFILNLILLFIII